MIVQYKRKGHRSGGIVGGVRVLVAILAVVAAPLGASAGKITDKVSVVDGDTVQIGSRVYDLYGIDAPELGQLCYHNGWWKRCGVQAAFELKKLLDFDKPLNCEAAPADRRKLVCHAASVDVALVLLKAGYAVAASESGVAYRQAEKSAREGSLGLWHMAFVSPSDWRQGKRLPGADDSHEAAECPVQGIVDEQGRKLYYVPTDNAYREMTVDPGTEARRFCSDGEARRAGWRRPGEDERRQ